MRTYVLLKSLDEIVAHNEQDLIPLCAIFEGNVSEDQNKIQNRTFIVVLDDASDAEIGQLLWKKLHEH